MSDRFEPVDPADAPPVRQADVRRVMAGAPAGAVEIDEVAVESPVALVFNGISHAVMMATPCDLEAFALGFALSEGLLLAKSECRGIEVVQAGDGAFEVQLEVAASAEMRLKEQRRSLVGRTGCGVCGIESLERLDLWPEPLAPRPWVEALTAATVLRAFGQLAARQPMNARSGAHHAAGWASPEGELLAVMEDVGRHNALDKLLGQRASNGQAHGDGFVVMSSRASYELLRKCARLGVPVLAAISAPTTLAIEIAQRAGMTLYGFCRNEQAVLYAGPSLRGAPPNTR